jgi:hypothetical protein
MHIHEREAYRQRRRHTAATELQQSCEGEGAGGLQTKDEAYRQRREA